MKSTLTFLAASAAFMAHASFELVLVADRTQNKIHRFDGTTGTYFGSFGRLNDIYGNNSAMVINQNRNEVIVNQGNLLRRYNYNTGEVLGAAYSNFVPTNLSLSRDAKFVYMTNNSSSIYQLEASTLSLTATFNFGSTYKIYSCAESETGALIGQDTQTAGQVFIRRFNTNLTVAGNQSLSGNPAPAAGQMSITQYVDISSGYGTNFSRLGVCGAYGGAIAYHGLMPSTGSLATFYDYSPYASDPLKTATSACGSHNGAYFGGTNAAGGALISRRDGYLAYERSFGLGTIGSCDALASVVAPEPGSLLALGLGALAIVGRRRRK